MVLDVAETMNREWAVTEALLLCADDGGRWSSCAPRDAVHGEIYTTTHTFRAPPGGTRVSGIPHAERTSMEGDVARCAVTKVVTIMRCSLRTFTSFITTPQNIQFHGDNAVLCDVIEERGSSMLMHTAHHHSQWFDLVTLHHSTTLHLSDEFDQNIPLQRFLYSMLRRESNTGGVDEVASAHGRTRSNSRSMPSKVYVYTIRSISNLRSPPSSEYVRGWIYLSAYVAYETPGPNVQLVFLHAPDEVASSGIHWCDKKIQHIRGMCETLHKMTLAPQRQLQQAYQLPQAKPSVASAVSFSEQQKPVLEEKYGPVVPDQLTPERHHVLRPLIIFQTKATWRFVLEREGCKVEECEARECLPTPPFLKAYRISTCIACPLATFLHLVGDPLQTQRYDAFMENSSIIGTRNEGLVLYAQYKPLSTYSSQRDLCILLAKALVQPLGAPWEELLSPEDRPEEGVYVQNAIQCNNQHPPCDGYERQMVYVFGYIATVINNAAAANEPRIKVHHIVCMDSSDTSDQRLEMALMQEHCTRMAWIRQICEDLQGVEASTRQAVAVHYSKNRVISDGTMDTRVTFTDIPTLEENISFIQSRSPSACYTEKGDLTMQLPCFTRDSPSQRVANGREGSMEAHTHHQNMSPLTHLHDLDATRDHLTPTTNTNQDLHLFGDEQTTVAAPYQGSRALLPPRQQSRPQRILRVDVRACRNLDSRNMKTHNLFILLQTSSSRVRTAPIAFADSCKFHNEKFFLKGYQGNTLTVTAVVCTPLGWMRRLGTAVIPLMGTLPSVPSTRWVSLVGKAGTVDSYVCGEVCLSLCSIERGSSSDNSRARSRSRSRSRSRGSAQSTREDAKDLEKGRQEESLRRRVGQLLMLEGRRNLHRLEWIVGICAGKPPEEVDALLARYCGGGGDGDVNITLTVIDIRELMSDKGLPLLNSHACHVKLEANGVKHRTRRIPLQQQQAKFNETFRVVVGANESIRVVVFVGGSYVGEVIVAPSPQERISSHILVRAAGTRDATACGKVTIMFHGTDSFEARKGKAESTPRSRSTRHRGGSPCHRVACPDRMMNLGLALWKLSPKALHKLDVIATSTKKVNHYMNALGPGAKWCELRVSIKRWEPSSAIWDSPFTPILERDEKGLEADTLVASHRRCFAKQCSIYAVIQSGLHYYKTSLVCTNNAGVAHFDDPVTLHGVLPERDKLLVAIIGKGAAESDDRDMGVVVLPLQTLVHQHSMVFTVPLVRHAGEQTAHFRGLLEVELLAINFGEDKMVPVEGEETSQCRTQVRQLLYIYDPKQLHRAECLLADYAGHKRSLVTSLLKEHGPDGLPCQMDIRLIGIRDFVPACSCYVKVYLNGTPVFRTSKQAGSRSITFATDNVKNAATVTLDDPQHAHLRFKVGQYRYLHTTSVSFVEISLRNMVADVVNECWVPFFDANYDKIGYLGVALFSKGFICRGVGSVCREDLENDVASLLRRYRPWALPFLQPMMTEMSSPATAHAEIRRIIAPRPVAATVYVLVENVSITHPNSFSSSLPWRVEQAEQKYTVTASCDYDEGSTIWSVTRGPSDAIIRLDIPDVGRCGSHSLVIVVRRSRGERGTSCSGKNSRERSMSPSMHANSSRNTIPSPSVAELGRVVVSLRALLTPALYNAGECVTLPLVFCAQSSTGRQTPRHQWTVQQKSTSDELLLCENVAGSISFKVRLPEKEIAPPWLQFDAATLERHEVVDRDFIRYYGTCIHDLVAQHDLQMLLHLHYTLYERHVAHGNWRTALPDCRHVLQQQLQLKTTPSGSPSPKAPSGRTRHTNGSASKTNSKRMKSPGYPVRKAMMMAGDETSEHIEEQRRSLFQ